MKIVRYSAGLGNQIFIYLFTKYLQESFPDQKVYGYYPRTSLNNHNGLEIDKVFDIQLPPSSWISNFVAYGCRILRKLGVNNLMETKDPCNLNAVLFYAYFQQKEYFLNNVSTLRFKDLELGENNELILSEIKSSLSVSVHIRRGDYLDPEVQKRYGNIATEQYYRVAINLIKEKIGSNIKFFVFSNDIEWCKANLVSDDIVFVEGNNGIKSSIDMYLMSNCCHHIIANSSFSYWGAMLNQSPNKYVIYPKIWDNIQKPDIFPSDWIGL